MFNHELWLWIEPPFADISIFAQSSALKRIQVLYLGLPNTMKAMIVYNDSLLACGSINGKTFFVFLYLQYSAEYLVHIKRSMLQDNLWANWILRGPIE
jgi:hypothetical protein